MQLKPSVRRNTFIIVLVLLALLGAVIISQAAVVDSATIQNTVMRLPLA